MNFLGFEISRAKPPVPTTDRAVPPGTVPTLPSNMGGGWLSSILEPFTGAWQRNLEGAIDGEKDVMTFSAVYACVSLISADIAKLRLKLVKENVGTGVWTEITDPMIPFLGVLRKPNSFQTRIQFFEQWIVNLLLAGNNYVLLERDMRGVVRAMYCLNPRCVSPLVASDGSVLYQIKRDPLAGIDADDGVVVPSSEIVHDRLICPFHPLVGVSAIYACAMSVTQGRRIQRNSAKFFENQSRPSGMLSAPSHIPDDTALRIKREWEANFTGGNIGRLAVLGDGLKYEPMTISAEDAQLIEQLRWTVEDVARCFKVPLHMLGVAGSNPSYNNIGALNQAYYSQTLQRPIEGIELLLDEGLGLVKAGYGTEFDLESLVRMDPTARADYHAKGIGAGYLKPNEARRIENLPPVDGGDTPYMQQQNYALAALASRDANDPLAQPPAPPPAPEPEEDDVEDDEEDDAEEGEDGEDAGGEEDDEEDDDEEDKSSSISETRAAELTALIIRGVLEDVDDEIAA